MMRIDNDSLSSTVEGAQIPCDGVSRTEVKLCTDPFLDKRVIGSSFLRLRSLLLDNLNGQGYVFDPESSEIIAVSSELEAAILKIVNGAVPDEERCDEVIERLGLSPSIESSESAPAGSSLGLRVHLNHDCNLGCIYCYADGSGAGKARSAKGSYGGDTSWMEPRTLQAGVAKLHEACSPDGHLLISLFGGEPFLSEDRFIESIALIRDAARRLERRVRLNVVTNATLLSERILECLQQANATLDVSLDGLKEVHDRQRPFLHGGGSFETVKRNIETLVEGGVAVNIRMTLRRQNESFFKDHLPLAELPSRAVGAYFDYYGESGTASMTESEAKEISTHFREIAKLILERNDARAKKLKIVQTDLKSIVVGSRARYACGVGRSFWAMAPDGTIFPCHRFVGWNEYAIGNVHDESFEFLSSPAYEALAVDRRLVTGDGRPSCGLCYAKRACAGGCAHVGAMTMGSISEMPAFYCQYARLRVATLVRYIAETLISSEDGST